MHRGVTLLVGALCSLAGGVALVGSMIFALDTAYGEQWIQRTYSVAYAAAPSTNTIYFLFVEYPRPGSEDETFISVSSDALSHRACHDALKTAHLNFPGAKSIMCWPVLNDGLPT